MRSCKRESIQRLNNEKEKQKLQAVKNNTLERFSERDAKRLLFSFLSHYNLPVSTYRLTKDFKRYHNINVSDNKILELCTSMKNDNALVCYSGSDEKGTVRKWRVNHNAVSVF